MGDCLHGSDCRRSQIAVEALAALAVPPVCQARAEWSEVKAGVAASDGAGDGTGSGAGGGAGSGAGVRVDAQLLGDPLRRGCEAPCLSVRAPASILEALTSEDTWHTVPVDDDSEHSRRPARLASDGVASWLTAADGGRAGMHVRMVVPS